VPRVKKRLDARFSIALLHDPTNPEPPSNARALQKFAAAAEALGMRAEFITRNDYARLTDFDALFVRDTTEVNHYTYRFARRALAEGLVVIDDPESILKCNNKVYLAEMLTRHGIPTPRTLLIHRDNTGEILRELGLPVVLKKPDSAFSLGVVKAETESELNALLARLLVKSDLIIAQEWLPTAFDWRVGVLDRRALFVARYHMVPGHWQIVQHNAQQVYREGATEAVAISEAPEPVVTLGVKAANLIGDGFYGVDLKQTGAGCYVIEVNDNPNVDAGNEDGVLRDALYREVMGTFLRRLEMRRNRVRQGVMS
jgi:glutathione synthase/RimK-type ligase-like ATP-grasp enzyme